MADYLEYTDEALLRLVQDKKEEAMECLFHRYLPIVEITASKYAGAPVDRDDLIQEGMLGFLSGVYSYSKNREASPKTYLQLCIERRMINAIRKCQRKKDFPPDAIVPLDEHYIDHPPTGETPEDFLIAKEQAQDLTNLLEENLSDLEINVLRLHMVGCTYSQISARLNKSTKTVDNALQRVRSKLNKLVL